MKRSANEISGHVLKAARGAGLPLGVCEDLAAAAPTLARDSQLGMLCAAFESATDALIRAPAFLDALECSETPDMPDTAWVILQALSVARGKKLVQSGTGAQFAGAADVIAATAIEVPDQEWAALNDYVKRTYVPATDASRLAGAGAGLTDND